LKTSTLYTNSGTLNVKRYSCMCELLFVQENAATRPEFGYRPSASRWQIFSQRSCDFCAAGNAAGKQHFLAYHRRPKHWLAGVLQRQPGEF
jgi:hypothetical protein